MLAILCFWLFYLTQADLQNLNPNSIEYSNFDSEYNSDYPYYPGFYFNDDLRCPDNWVQFQQFCYKFNKSPLRPYTEARRLCQTYSGDPSASERTPIDLVSLNSVDEHSFLVQQLNRLDPQHRRWYIGAHQTSANFYSNPDASPFPNMENAIIWDDDSHSRYGAPDTDFLVYKFSKKLMHWILEPVVGDEPLSFICKSAINDVQRLRTADRDYTYGTEITDPERIPRGPYFIEQPKEAIFDGSKRTLYNDVSLSCLAGGYPTPTYNWYREDYENDMLIPKRIDPLTDSRYTVSGGKLIIHDPQQRKDRATYHCRASNKFGTIISESVSLNFGFILEFILKRSPEVGDLNWGKTIFCDPPNHFPDIKYSWSRDYFPNFVEEDQRVFVSYDGSLYFSALETIDRAKYSCSVQSEFSDSGRNGPFFPLRVNPHSNYQTLKFANNFPKAFPEAPIAGKEVRLECIAFG